MRRLLALLLAATGVAALLARRKRAQSAAAPAPAPMPRPTAAPASPPTPAPAPAPSPVAAEPEPTPEPEPAPPPVEPTPGPIDEGEPGAITAAPVPDAEAVTSSDAVEPPDDATLVHEVTSTIAQDPVVPEDGVKVEVEDGVAELTGTVPDETTAQRAGDVAAHVDGVIGLDNKLEPAEEQRGEEPRREED
jgi:hypothetical protein